NSGQCSLQLIHSVRERRVCGKAKRNMLVETGHEHLVVRVAGAGTRQGSRNHFRALRSHASTVVDNQTHRDRNVFLAKILDLLEDSVLIDSKVVFAEPRNKNSSA